MSNDFIDPPGVEFFDTLSQRQMKLVTDGSWAGWIVYKHPDGQWVTLRRLTEYERKQDKWRKILTKGGE